MPRVAGLARQLGFRVIALVDGDKSTPQNLVEIKAIEDASDAIVRLPDGVAVEAAIVGGFDAATLRTATATAPAYGLVDPLAAVSDDAKVSKTLIKSLHSIGFHEQLLTALTDQLKRPELVRRALDAITLAADPAYAGPKILNVTPLAPAGGA